jgi:hypothetical protein
MSAWIANKVIFSHSPMTRFYQFFVLFFSAAFSALNFSSLSGVRGVMVTTFTSSFSMALRTASQCASWVSLGLVCPETSGYAWIKITGSRQMASRRSPREVTWYRAPANSIRIGRAMPKSYRKHGLNSRPDPMLACSRPHARARVLVLALTWHLAVPIHAKVI